MLEFKKIDLYFGQFKFCGKFNNLFFGKFI